MNLFASCLAAFLSTLKDRRRWGVSQERRVPEIPLVHNRDLPYGVIILLKMAEGSGLEPHSGKGAITLAVCSGTPSGLPSMAITISQKVYDVNKKPAGWQVCVLKCGNC